MGAQAEGDPRGTRVCRPGLGGCRPTNNSKEAFWLVAWPLYWETCSEVSGGQQMEANRCVKSQAEPLGPG